MVGWHCRRRALRAGHLRAGHQCGAR